MKTTEIIKRYVAHVNVTYRSPATRKVYLTRMYQFTDAHTELHRISSTYLKEYLYDLQNIHKLSDSYFNQMLAALNIIYSTILGQRYKLKDIKSKKSRISHWKVLTPGEVSKMIIKTSNRKHKMIIKLLYVLGVRISELLNLKLSNIDRANNQIFIRAGKGAKDRAIDIDQVLLEQLEEYWYQYKPEKYIIEGYVPGRKYSKTSVVNILKKHEQMIGKKIWPHLLRHSIASEMINKNVNIAKLKYFLGHKDIRSTEYYYHYIKNEGMLCDAQLEILMAA